ncbi:NUDIX hydrolase domain-like protein [Xylariales sp. AK1849]|nr:NUDIX hydrolase domain-like protein [Xylariales sp. AK1849]
MMAQPEPKPHVKPPAMDFEINEPLAEWTVPAQAWLTTNDKHWAGLCSGNLVFNPSGKILIVQRASHDSMPDRWEVPGGAIDPEDASIVHGAARELWEEAGLVARRFNYMIPHGGVEGAPGQVFTNRNGTRVFCRVAFDVDVHGFEVTLDADEHQDFVWATEQEVSEQTVGERTITITHAAMKALILEGFRMRREKGKSS